VVSDEYQHNSCITGRRYWPAGQYPFHGADKGGEEMGKLSAFKEARQLTLGDIGAITDGNGLCPNRMLCLVHRLNVSWEALENGHKCAFEENGQLYQCHLSGIPKPMEV